MLGKSKVYSTEKVMVLDIIKQIRECQDTSLSNSPSQVSYETENWVRLEDLSSKSSFELPAVITLDFSKSFNLFGPHFPRLVKEGSRPAWYNEYIWS